MSESMRASHRDAQTRTDTQTCEECGQPLDDGTETVCDDCGLVADEDAIDRRAEWRCDDTGERARAGTAVDRTRHDNGFSTRIGFERSSASSEKHRRLLPCEAIKQTWVDSEAAGSGEVSLRYRPSPTGSNSRSRSATTPACCSRSSTTRRAITVTRWMLRSPRASTRASARIEHVGIAVRDRRRAVEHHRTAVVPDARPAPRGDRRRHPDRQSANVRRAICRRTRRRGPDGDARPRGGRRGRRGGVDRQRGRTVGSRCGCVYEAFVAAQWGGQTPHPRSVRLLV